MLKKWTTLVLLWLFIPGMLLAQRTVNGKVVDSETGETLIGAVVKIKGTQGGAVTDIEGAFSLSMPANASELEVSYLGYSTKTAAVSGNQIIIQLTKKENRLDDVVVIGYGTVQRRDLTGSVSQVKMSDLTKAPTASFDEALGGRIAGVQASTGDGQPGTVPNIIIRGSNSITQDNSPLYIIDGFPVEESANSAINPSDIESIDILKDASATAIYGARGANGVVIITTKTGKAGKPTISFDSFYGLQNDTKRIKLLNAYEFVKLQLEIANATATDIYLTRPNRTLEDYRNIESVDWYDKVLQTAPMQNYSLGIRGGNKETKYSVSGSILDQTGIFLSTGFKRYQGRVTLSQELNKKAKISLNTNYATTNQLGSIVSEDTGGASSSIMNNIWAYRPVLTTSQDDIEAEEQLIDPEIDPNVQFRVNPLLELQNAFRERIRENIMVNTNFEYDITPKLKLRITGGLNQVNFNTNSFNNSNTRSGSTIFSSSIGVNGSRIFNNNSSLVNENTLSYSTRINRDHKIDAVAGYTQQQNKSSLYGAAANRIPNESLGLSGIDQGEPRTIESRDSRWALQSFLGRVNYSYKSRYLFTGTFRADGSSKFAPGNRWAYFPSAAFAYRLSEEKFIKNIKVISDAKFRMSYGKTGNNRVNDFAYLSEIQTGLDYAYSFNNELPAQGSVATDIGNPLLKWETTDQYDVGLELGLWNGRVTFTGDLYYKRTHDLLLRAQIPNSSGYIRTFLNVGSVSNKGLELTLNTVNIDKQNFKWNTDFNISFNSNEVLALIKNQSQIGTSIAITGSTNNTVYVAEVGGPVAQFYGLIYDGVYQYEDFDELNGSLVLKPHITGNGGARADIRPGDAKYRDLSGDKNISSSDYSPIGNPNPDFYGGFNNNFVYKGFDLNVFFQYSYGNEVFNANKISFENGRTIGAHTNQFAAVADRWSPENQDSNIPAANRIGGNFYSTRSVEDASYIRLKTVSLGYKLPFSFIDKFKINSVRLYASAQNLVTWTNYSGTDPEVSTRNTSLTPGFDLSPYPRSRTIVFGINANF